jgi:coenzyme F420-reducing hydrogenase delta subunit/ferredoxin
MTYEPKIVAFLCTWCSYTGADTAGISRLKSPANIRAIRVPCSGRVSPELIMRTFDQGADGVIVLGCHIGECHYVNGNHRTAKRMPILGTLMEFAGLEPNRFRLDWVSASEGERFSRIVTEFTNEVKSLGPIKWRATGEKRLPEKYEWSSQIFPTEITSPSDQQINPEDEQDYFSIVSEKIRQTAKSLLTNGEVECVIGYEISPRGITRPTFIYSPDDTQRLVWNRACTHNLTNYLNDKLKSNRLKAADKKVAIVVKPCDSRAINVMLVENRFRRNQLHVIGVACSGIQQDGNGQLQERCKSCSEKTPIVYDTLISEPSLPVIEAQPDRKLQYLEQMSVEERMEYWLSQFDRCIRCYACRQACPICDCSICLYERDDSLWMGMKIGLNEKRTFHLGRAYHLAGRCVGCDECERVCPMNISISLLNQKLSGEIEKMFGFRAGLSATPPPLVTVLEEQES